MNGNHSDYIIYVDESGDHGLKSIDPDYPVFVLAFCIFKQDDYINDISPALNILKLKYWGHTDIVLHEHDIRKNMHGDWFILNNQDTRLAFLTDLSNLLNNAPFEIIASVIDKEKLKHYKSPQNPYELAMLFCMERLNNLLLRSGQKGKTAHIQFEARGKTEDEELELEFRRICDNASGTLSSNTKFDHINYSIRFLDKKVNSIGLQIADLIARPIGIHELRPNQKNTAFDIIERKFIRHDNGKYHGRGLKKFP